MHHSKRFGCQVYPVLFLIVLSVSRLMAQNPTSSDSQAPAPVQTQQPENPQQNQVRLAQEAQARIQARRAARKQRVVQDTYSHKFEVYGGGGDTRFRPGESLQHINQSLWNGGFTDHLWARWGLTGDLRGYYGTAFITPNPYNIFKPSISEYSFMAGPQYRIVRREHWAISGQALVGGARGNSMQVVLGFLPARSSDYGVKESILVWRSVCRLTTTWVPGFAARIQPGYRLTTFGGTAQVKNIGFNAGIVYRFLCQ